MDSFIEPSIIVNDSDDFSSFEIEESIIIGDSDDIQNESVNKNVTNIENSTRKVNVSIATGNYRSPDSSKSSTSESDAIVLSSDDEDDSIVQTESQGTKAVDVDAQTDSRTETEVSNNSEKNSSSSDEKSREVIDVTKAEYDAHVVKIGEISERISQYENLLKFSSQLPDKGHKLKELVVKLKSELTEKTITLEYIKVKEPTDLDLDFQNLSINENDNEKESESETSYEDTDDTEAVSNLFAEIKRSETSMPSESELADQPRLINGNLMKHQREALAWMVWRENNFPNGGILGDDMGLGKTLSMISLIARHIEMRDSKSEEKRRDGSGRTLVVCPASVIRQWEDEIDKFSNSTISVCLHHGDKRATSARELRLYEVVLTTYGIVRTEVEKNGVLAQIKWERIILDEAHTIRNYSSKQSLSCCRLNATKRWALTGTPIQNKHADVYALIKFLQCSPLNDFKTWKHWTNNKPEQKISYILKYLLLRRTKNELGKIGEITSLPEKTLEIIKVKLSSDEMKVYGTVSSFSKILSDKFRHQRNPDGNASHKNNELREHIQRAMDFFTISGSISTSHILLVILRLRQICIHPNLIDAMLMEEDIRDISSAESDLLVELNELTIGGTNSDQKLLRSNPVFDAHRPSSKFDSVLQTIRTKVIERREKAVVVSQFTSVLELFENHLRSHQIKYSVLNGSTKITHRQDIVKSFNHNTDEQILLLSLTAGGVGLNLCGANNLFFIDPHWNPQLESQAEDRVYRIGQTKPVTIYRFICEGTIEERIQNLQERKRGLAKNILSGYKLNIDDMMGLI